MENGKKKTLGVSESQEKSQYNVKRNHMGLFEPKHFV